MGSPLLRFVGTRLVDAAIAVWAVVTIVFMIVRLLGDPAAVMLPVGFTQEQLVAARNQLGLDQPLLQQYARYVIGVLHGDFGQSFQFFRPAIQIILERMPATIALTCCAVVVGTAIGIVAGLLAGMNRGRFADALTMFISLAGQATPIFWLGIMLILFFAVYLGWLPTGGYESPASFVLPTLTLSTFVSANVARLLRSSVIEIIGENYIRTAYAKGLALRVLIFRHIFRSAVVPVVTMVGLLTGELLGGSVVTETVFSWPGVGRTLMQAIDNRDFPVIQAGIIVVSTGFVLISLVVDLVYGWLDPRIRLATQ
jgi:peptide/nickel transport system permease protein